jgi:predicted nucleic acid-binding protein
VIVFDASLALKWYFEEPSADAAKAALVQHGGEIVVPSVFLVEVSAALVRRANADKLHRDEMEAALEHFLTLISEQFITVRETGTEDMARAVRLALDLGHPLKDCIYLALAMKIGCELLTSDLRLAAKGQPLWPKIRVVEG